MRTAEQTVAAATAALEARFAEQTPLSADYCRRAEGVLTGGNTRSNLLHVPHMAVIDRAEGDRLFDIDGNCYFDLLNDFTVAAAGHSHPRLLSAAAAQLERGMSYGGCIREEAELGLELQQRFPALQRIRFANSGTEANLYALQAALLYRNSKKLLVFDGCYHGGLLNYLHRGPILNFPVETVRVPFNDCAAFSEAMAIHGDTLGAVMIELLMNSGGCIPAAPAFVRTVRQETLRAGIPLIIDEVMTARLGYHGLQGVFDVRADLVTLGKVIGGGFSAGAFGGAEDVMAAYDGRSGSWTPHGGSFNNNVMSMRVGLIALQEVLTAPALAAMNRRGEALREMLGERFASADVPLNVTGMGSVMNVHWGREAPVRPAADPHNALVQRLFHRYMLVEGFWVATRALLALSVATRESTLEQFLSAVDRFLAEHGGLLRDLQESRHAPTHTH